jgi:ribosome-associated heat shock protein Hsp15
LADRQRIDKWLFFARVTKSRSLAAKLAQAGRIRLNGEKIDQASQTVKPGDTLTITLDRQIRILRVADPGTRRGPYEEAKTLYEDLTPEQPSGKQEGLPALAPVREAGTGRPTKRERRQLDRWRDGSDD